MSPALAWWMWCSICTMMVRDAPLSGWLHPFMHMDGALLRKNNEMGPS